jgi:hypothetical protein
MISTMRIAILFLLAAMCFSYKDTYSSGNQYLLSNAREMVEIDTFGDPHYHIADNKLG